MTKLRFDNITLKSFNFKLIPKKKKFHVENKRLTKLVKGICTKINDEYKIALDVKIIKPEITDDEHPDILVLDFTEESYNIKGATTVFSRTLDENGRYVRYIRNELNAKCLYGDEKRYVPFCHNWICSGYVVKRDGKLLFDFNECISPKGYGVAVIENY